MKIFLILSIIITICFVFRNLFYSAKRNLFKNQAEWFSKDIKIKYSKSKEISSLEKNDNYLKIIADESNFYLEEQANQD